MIVETRRWCRMNGCSVEPDEGSEFCRTHRFSAGETNGRALLDRMDAGEPLTSESDDSEVSEEAKDVGSTPENGNAPHYWSREEIIAAIQQWARLHDGQPPTQRDWIRRGDYHPAFSTAAKRFDGWSDAIRAAGFEPRSRSSSDTASEREPQAEAAAATHAEPQRTVSPPPAVKDEAASRSEITVGQLLDAIAWADGSIEEIEVPASFIRTLAERELERRSPEEIGAAVLERIRVAA